MIVYKVTNIINSKVYIGKTIRDIGHAKARLYYIYRNTREKLSKAKRMYTEEQAKSITKLRDIDKLTFKDIAERLGFKNPSTVYRIYKRHK